MRVMLDKGAILPTRAHEGDAGLDIYAPCDVTVNGCKYETVQKYDSNWKPFMEYEVSAGKAVIDTGVHVEIPFGMVGFIKSKSGLMAKKNITADGTIDCGYTGSIKVILFNHGADPVYFKAGDKIAQLVVQPCELCELHQVDSLEKTERGDGGLGSTGR